MEHHALRPKDVLDLAAPSTWAASVMPCILAIALSYKQQGFLRPLEALCLFVGAILMQSAVNALNDYADFVKGTDTLENSPDASDAVIVYGLDPKVARNCGIAFLVLALLGPGLGAALLPGPTPLIIGLVYALELPVMLQGIMRQLSLQLGQMFQVRDDLKDWTEDEQQAGKPVNEDFAKGLYTIPAIHAFADETVGDQLRKLAALEHPSKEDLAQARRLVTQAGGIAFARDYLEQLAPQALDGLSALPAGPYRDALQSVVHMVARA